jgi:cell division protease FtsH
MKPKFAKKSFQGGPKNILVATLIFVASVVLLTKLVEQTRQVTPVTYSAFLKRVEQDDVKKVHIVGQDVYGVFRDGSRFETVIAATNPRNWDLLKDHNVEVSLASQSGQFNLWYLIPLILSIIGIFAFIYFMRQSRNAGNGGGSSNIFSMGKSRAKMFMPSTIKENFDSVAGATEAKEELKDLVDFLKNPDKYRKLGAKITRGVLLIGEPGNGKTLLARAVAGEANCPFFAVSGSDFIEVFVGVGAARVRDLFAQARKHAPSIIFIDEIDAVGRHRGSGLGGGHDEREQTLNQLLTEMDGFTTTGGSVVVLAATNRADVLDKALLRPGRFDRRVHVPFPDLYSREKILQVHAKEIKLDPEVDLHKVARGTPGFSGADLANLINEAAINASKHDQETVVIKDFEEARDKMILGKESKTIVLSEQERKITAYHEGGHALVRLMMPNDTDPLHKVTIIPRGGALGVTHWLPEKDKYLRNKEEILANITSAMGGRAAEELVFGLKTSGAQSDFARATEMARDMVVHLGMSDLGPVIYYQEHGNNEPSQKTREKIDQAIHDVLTTCYDDAMNILRTNRDKLDTLAQALLDKETLYAGEIYPLLGIEPRAEHKFS